jgi:hypothetical protein
MSAPDEFFLGFDINGDPIILTLSDFFPDVFEWRTGQYIMNAYIVESKNGKGPSKIGGPKK